jgi:asparagine synthase (glutamine-hydrolysing)
MQAQCSQPIRTFTIGFEREDYDEAPGARAVATHLGTRHTELYVSPADMLAVVTRIPELYDEPFSDASQIPTFLVARLARSAVTVGLSGDGGDELFGGYTRYRLGDLAGRTAHRLPYPVRRGLAAAAAATPAFAASAAEEVARRVLRLRPRSARAAMQSIAAVLAAKDAGALYRYLLTSRADGDPLATGTPAPSSDLGQDDGAPRLGTLVERMMFWDTVGYLPDDILTKVDRATMSVGLEARVPLLDPRVLELAWRLPLALKWRGGVTKLPIRRILARYVPPALVDRPKKGFAVPLGDWLRGPLREWARDLLAPAALRRTGLLDERRCTELLGGHLSGACDRADELWNALVLQAWCEAGAAVPATAGRFAGSAS